VKTSAPATFWPTRPALLPPPFRPSSSPPGSLQSPAEFTHEKRSPRPSYCANHRRCGARIQRARAPGVHRKISRPNFHGDNHHRHCCAAHQKRRPATPATHTRIAVATVARLQKSPPVRRAHGVHTRLGGSDTDNTTFTPPPTPPQPLLTGHAAAPTIAVTNTISAECLYAISTRRHGEESVKERRQARRGHDTTAAAAAATSTIASASHPAS
jgi:hypothetical protein